MGKNIIIKLGINIVIFLILLVVIWFYYITESKGIENIQNDLKKNIESYNNIRNNGIDFNKFVSMYNKGQKNNKDEEYSITNIKYTLGDNGKEFYNKYFYKNSPEFNKRLNICKKDGSDCEDEIDCKKIDGCYDQIEQKIKIFNGNPKNKKREKQLNHVIPSYTKGFNIEDNMTDLDFINYIETLLYTFGLTTDSVIGIDRIEEYNEDTLDKKKKSSEKNAIQIFKIPIKLNLRGKKIDVVEFIYFLENVGNIKKDDKKNSILKFKEENDSEILSRTNILGQENSRATDIREGTYNIFENMFVDIKTIIFDQYLDEAVENRTAYTTTDFYKFLKKYRGFDYLDFQIEMNFYVKTIPLYKITSFIKNVEKNYKATKKIIENKRTSDISENNIPPLMKSKKNLDSLEKDMDDIMKQLKKGTDINKLYINALKIDQIVKKVKINIENIK